MKTNHQNAKLLLLLITISLTLVFSACKKDKDDDPKSKTELLTSASWKMTANTVNPAYPIYDDEGNVIGSSSDIYAEMDACSKDDTFKFNTDFTMMMDEGATKCDNDDPQTATGSWAFKSNETILSVTEDGFTQDVTILELSENTLRFQFTESLFSETYTYTLTFSH